ncbi:MAG: GNAT family N-acetyltransferase [Hespellia sp.]|nr:GNAT family N-acetyltransferase [Hespellia sp.]
MNAPIKLRKLEVKEHKKTRALWESVFSEDTKAFLDYYYRRKTADNQIYVVEEQKKIISMLQLNPYSLRIQSTRVRGNYIIAVATEAQYRSRGMMRALLIQAMKDMYRAKEPFTFLMPAAEAIYTPYDFRFVYDQDQSYVRGVPAAECTRCKVKEASLEDTKKMAAFAMRYLKETCQVYAYRDEDYYLTMMLEQRAENGGVKLVWDGRRLVGMFAYAKEEAWEIREPIFQKEYENYFAYAVYALTRDTDTAVKCLAYRSSELTADTEKHPMIMVRILYLKKLFSAMRVKSGEQLSCSFAVLDPILHENSRIWHLSGDEKGNVIVGESEDSQGALTIGALTSLLFGYKQVGEIAQEENVLLTEELMQQLKKIQPLEKIFLNEIV